MLALLMADAYLMSAVGRKMLALLRQESGFRRSVLHLKRYQVSGTGFLKPFCWFIALVRSPSQNV
ncbi:hypothetical protein J0895_06530 [Phormidium pseudopriestleyi FRX01]|uniref:Uncharacterized protein n=1 Tax=Phormidium pseudopriestleyi FRX01 TaxID=1759528 RepID=A0ABS3FQY1_9CYAN|nr:hypothetical protein [Phormidium pseudopriestleyi]MBO0348762.1 hypothetical protein [Phormidium pseudopriestleyi FRX01]